MTKKGWMAAGLTVGLIAGSCVSAFAAEGLKYVQASINDTFKFQVNGEAKTLDDEYTVLVYKDRTYLPVRGIGELMGADIDWDDATKTVLIDTSKLVGNGDTDKPDTPNTGTDEEPTIEYKSLPQIYEDYYLRVDAETYFEDKDGDRLFIKLKNKTDGKVLRLVSAETNYTYEGKTYTMKDVDSVNWDTRWYTKYIEEDQELEGYLRLPKDLEMADGGELQVHIALQFDGESQLRPVDFNLKVKPVRSSSASDD